MQAQRLVPDVVAYDGVRSAREALRACAARWPEWFPKYGELFGGCYCVRGVLADGEFSVVLLAWDVHLEREVAIKLVHPAFVLSTEVRDLLLSEARAMARVRHENVVEIFSFDDHQGAPYFTMEFIPGQHVESWRGSLSALPVPLDEALAIVDQVCRGVSAIHAAGAIHRALSWSNILLGPAFRVCVGDLSLAHILDASRPRPAIPSTPYTAPEDTEGSDYEFEPRSDVYSLGVMAYELLTGRLPDDESSTIDPAIEAALRRACAREHTQRTPTPEDFRRELQDARNSLSQPIATGLRFVVADDDDDFVDLITALLETTFEGCDVVRVSDGIQALHTIGDAPPSLAVLDLDMPGINGIELTSLLRARPGLAHMPIIVATATGGAPDWRLLRSIGADGFVVKPVDPRAFVALARRTLGYAATIHPAAMP